ncbi:MAG: beta-ketoacyl-ACP synthase II [Spirochaetales bacterium]|nr:beta-ketoacyl-ACP synthase II [Spirochaetales bacterium]
MERRVVVTGIGTVNPIGNNVTESWDAIKQGKSGISRVDRFDVQAFPSKVCGAVKNLDIEQFIDKKEARKYDRFTILAMISSLEAYKSAGLANSKSGIDPERFGVIIGNGIGGILTLTEAFQALHFKGPMRIHPLTIPKMIPNIGPGNIAIRFNAQGPCYAVVTACSSGADAIGNAFHIIKNNIADIMITGGTEAPITEIAMGGFCTIQTLSRNFNDTPEKASRPFDKDRDGFVLAEGAGILIIEELEHAKKRGAKILAELVGYGLSCDANHLTAPHPEGRGAVQAMQMALNMANMQPGDIDYINAHGTSTQLNDPTETKAIKKVFGEHAKHLKVSSTKSLTGHMIGGAGGFEAAVSVLAIQNQFFPPTCNHDNPDPECDLDYVPNKGYNGKIRAVMSNSLGFGGHNGILIFKEFKN